MFFLRLKRIFVFSVVAAGTYFFVLSCDNPNNPFSANLGSKVDVERPTISVYVGEVQIDRAVEKYPLSGGFVQGVVQFAGEAEAFRELRRVEVRILDPRVDPSEYDEEKGLPPLLAWTDITQFPPETMLTGALSGSAKKKIWNISLDTLKAFSHIEKDINNNDIVVPGMDDGFLKIQFRAFDPNLESEITTMVYIIKNGPSQIGVTSPGEIPTDTEFLGNVIDRRGVKPGYPRIKIWPDTLPSEPAGNDPNWGWVTLFLSGIDDIKAWTYTDRVNRDVDRTVNFSLRLSKFKIVSEPVTVTDTATGITSTFETRKAIYERTEDGNFIPMEVGTYNYRIVTYDTFYHDDVKQLNYLKARNPDPSKDEVETVSWYPIPNNLAAVTEDSGPYNKIEVASAGENPRVWLNNDDIRATDAKLLEQQPNIYIIEGQEAKKIKKIAAGNDKATNPDKYTDFRLRILTSHPDGIDNATLQWEHTGIKGFRTGSLNWDGAGGVWDNTLQGTIFRFTAFNDLTYTNDNGVQALVFESSTEPYTLIVTVNTSAEINSAKNKQTVERYTLYLNNDGPSITVKSIRGAADLPTADPTDVTGGNINESPYEVNGNIQVAVIRSASMGFMQETNASFLSAEQKRTGYPVVKWALERAGKRYDSGNTPRPETEADLRANTNSLYAKLLAFRDDPSAKTLEFFNNKNNFSETNVSTMESTSGWITLEDQNGTFEEDKYANFKVRVDEWNGEELWLYVIAQDAIHNLSYAVQKVVVNEESDRPKLNVLGLVPTTGPDAITDLEDLTIELDSNKAPTRNKVNVLDRNEGISLNFADDDGIKPDEGDKGINITIYSQNLDTTKTINAADMIRNNNVLREWDGTLSQSILGAALDMGTYLEDGLYTLKIQVPDYAASKVQIGSDVPAVKKAPTDTAPLTFHFAVQSQLPVVEVYRPRGLRTMATAVPFDVVGTVKSRLRIQDLEVRFAPDVITPATVTDPNNCTSPPAPTLEWYVIGKLIDNIDGVNKDLDPEYVDPANRINGTSVTWKDILVGEDGYYTYYWRIPNVNFDPPALFTGPGAVTRFDWRNFTVTAWDGLGDRGITEGSVDVDTTPPDVNLEEFNWGRVHVTPGDRVNGKVRIDISAYDPNGIGSVGEGTSNHRATIKWWVLPEGATPPTFETPFPSGSAIGGGGWFAYSTTGRYNAIFDVSNTTNYPNTTAGYNLYVIAQDVAGNASNTLPGFSALKWFRVDPQSDYPTTRPELPIAPAGGKIISTTSATDADITGTIYDDDGFNNANLNDYISIRFPNPNGASWGDWIPIANGTPGHLVNLSQSDKGDLVFKFTMATADISYNPGYLTSDGEKLYQIRVRDEVAAGPNNVPVGKNPVSSDPAVNANNIARVTVYLPSDSTTAPPTTPAANSSYSFNIKNTPPLVFFRVYDPVQTTTVNSVPPVFINHPNYSAVRPSYRQVGDLQTALNGGWVQEPASTLDNIYFTYGSGTQQTFTSGAGVGRYITAVVSPTETRHTWTIDPGWLSAFSTNDTDGRHSITIEAVDKLGQSQIVQWEFDKDTVGPDISFNNISRNTIMTISGEANAISVTGQFNDLYSNIAGNFQYKLYRAGAAVPNNWTAGTFTDDAGKSRNWSVPITGTFANDGVYYLQIQVADSLGNITMIGAGTQTINGVQTATGNPIQFVVDRANPRMIASASIKAAGVTGIPTDGILPESRRIFSAKSVTADNHEVVYTLRGLVYEHNLETLTASIRNGTSSSGSITPVRDLELTNIDEQPVSWKNSAAYTLSYGNGDGDNANGINTANSTFRLRRARTANPNDLTDFGSTAIPGMTVTAVENLYVWELDICKGAFYNLMHETGIGVNDDSLTRSVAITARDLARNDSETEVWQFKLDSSTPEITFSNVKKYATVSDRLTLEDAAASLTLTGAAEDATNIKSIDYRLERYNYATGAWAIVTTATTNLSNGWRNVYTNSSTDAANDTQSWSINNAATGSNVFNTEGLYRLSVRAADFSLSSVPGDVGNPNTDTQFQAEFFIDRSDPVIAWTDTLKEYYRWDNNTNGGKIVFNVSVTDPNTLNTTDFNNRTGSAPTPVTDYCKGVLRVFNGAVVSGVTVTIAESSNHNISPTNLTVTITRGTTDITPGRYTLELTIIDKADRKATVDQSISFTLDNIAPTIALDPNNATPSNSTTANNIITEAITGRVVFRGSFTKPSGSPVVRVAYAVTTGAPPAHTNANGVLPDDQLKNNWLFNDSTVTGYRPFLTSDGTTNGTKLMEINAGLAVANITLYNTQLFMPGGTPISTLLGSSVAAGNNITFGEKTVSNVTSTLFVATDGAIIYGDNLVNKLTLHLLAIDEAGNSTVTSYDYWVYPAGDRPRVTTISNPNKDEAEIHRQLNGTIRISGTATDNYRVGSVWFRVLKDGYTNAQGVSIQHSDSTVPVGYEPATNMRIPEWDSFGNATSDWQPNGVNAVSFNRDGTNYGGGWFKASGGGKPNVAWWAQINTNGELDPTATNTRKIIIQVMAEDAILNDYPDSNTDSTGHTKTGLLSNRAFDESEVSATIVVGAPRFEVEQVKAGYSPATASVPYTSILTTAVKGLASYQVTVRHDLGVEKILLTNVPNLSATANLLNYSSTSKLSGTGVDAWAEPKATTTAIIANNTYLIWTPGGNLTGIALKGGGTLQSSDNVKYTVFTAGEALTLTGGANVLQRVDITENNVLTDKYFEWLVTVDINTDTISGGYYSNKADHYSLNLEAHEISKSVPLFTRKTARVPIDNLPPTGRYTLNTSIAGTAQNIGGEANDNAVNPGTTTTAPVQGLSRVVLWFSRATTVSGVTAERSIVWDEKSYTPATNTKLTFNNGLTTGGGTANSDLIDETKIGNWGARGVSYTSVTLPNIPFDTATLAAGVNNSCIVINQQDPQGKLHHGHQLPMGWAPTGNATSWYVALDSTKIESGRVTAHYIVYDQAGNGTYYNQKLMILNGIPKISKVTLATDIYGSQSPLSLQTADVAWPASGNLRFGTGTVSTSGQTGTLDGNTVTAAGSAIDTIRAHFTGKDLNLASNTDESKGIREIPIDTSRPGDYSVIFDHPDFVVRNKLLAIKVDTLVPQTSANKDRYYRVEYVSNARQITTSANDYSNFTDQTTGIIAGRVYLINNLGNNFPWAVLGVQGETIQRGTVFLAVQNGSDLALGTTNYGTPSVWELNDYYSGGNTLNRNVPSALRFSSSATPSSTGNDVKYNKLAAAVAEDNPAAVNGMTAEFVYREGAFGSTAGSTIRDFNAGTNGANLDTITGRPKPYSDLAAATTEPWSDVSLFIIKVFDGPDTSPEEDLFGDFALLSVRVNNNDVTPPYSQIYDLNPRTQEQSMADALGTGGMGGNRTRGGLYRTGTTTPTDPAKSGHIEPRTGTSLTNTDMGGTSGTATVSRPAVNTGAYFTVDTVSGDVIVRGYAEDNQRIARVDLEFWNEINAQRLPNNTGANSSTTILVQRTTGNTANFLQSPISDSVKWTETVELDRHRVEWAYVWNTENLPGAANVVGNFNVRAIAYNANSDITAAANTTVPASENVHTSKRITRSAIVTPGTAGSLTARVAFDSFNPDFPASTGNFYRYNDIRVNIRPYITGFLRNTQAEFYHNTRSRQGRYMLRQGETPVVTGFNLGYEAAAANTSVTLGSNAAITAGAITTTAQRNNYVVNTTHRGYTPQTTTPASGNNRVFTTRYRIFSSAIPNTAATGDGMVTLTVSGYAAVNTGLRTGTGNNIGTTNNGSNRWIALTNATTTAPINPAAARPRAIQPWNVQFSGVEGSELWDDFTQVHIWRSDDTNPNSATDNYGNSRFAASANWVIMNPAMSIDAVTGNLYGSHNESGSGGSLWGGATATGNQANSGTSKLTSNIRTDISATAGTSGLRNVAEFRDPIIMSDVYRTPGAGDIDNTWTAFSIIGRSANGTSWNFLGGIYVHGPGGTASRFNVSQDYTNVNGYLYAVESTWYNSSSNALSPTVTAFPGGGSQTPATTEQFENPHIVGWRANNTGNENIHVSYYDSKDGSIKYRYNVQGTPNRGLRNNTTLDSARDTGTNGETTTTAHVTTTRNLAEDLRQWVNLDGGYDNEDTAGTSRVVGLATRNRAGTGAATARTDFRDAGQHNSIAIASPNATSGYPVVAYFDMTNQRLKLAISNNNVPTAVGNWTIRDNIIPSDDRSAFGTGHYVSLKIDTRAATNIVHIAALNSVTKQLVYVRGTLSYSGTTPTYTTTDVQVVDSVGDVGSWCSLSLDQNGNPWISYQDEGYLGAKDGVKVAYKNTVSFTKGSTNNYPGGDTDINGKDINGWEAMHVPTNYRVNDARLGMENFPTRNFTGTVTGTKNWIGAVSYLAPDYYRIAYYVK